jgi:hypothetical protein
MFPINIGVQRRQVLPQCSRSTLASNIAPLDIGQFSNIRSSGSSHAPVGASNIQHGAMTKFLPVQSLTEQKAAPSLPDEDSGDSESNGTD